MKIKNRYDNMGYAFGTRVKNVGRMGANVRKKNIIMVWSRMNGVD